MDKTVLDKLSKKIIPLTKDLVAAYVTESKKPTASQIQAALFAGFSAFLSTLLNDGVEQQAFKAAFDASRSLSHAVDIANLYTDKIQTPKNKFNKTFSCASKLVSGAAVSRLPEFPEEEKDNIRKDIEDSLRLYSCLRKESPKGGSWGNHHIFDTEYYTDWLIPDEDDSLLSGSGWRDWLPWNWGKSSKTEDEPPPIPDVKEEQPVAEESKPPRIEDISIKPPESSQMKTSSEPKKENQSGVLDWIKSLFTSGDNTSNTPGFWSILAKFLPRIGLTGLLGGLGGWGLLSMNPVLASALVPLYLKGMTLGAKASWNSIDPQVTQMHDELLRTSNSSSPWYTRARAGIVQYGRDTIKEINKALEDEDLANELKKLKQTAELTIPAVAQDYLVQRYKKGNFDLRQKQFAAQKKEERAKEIREVEEENADREAYNIAEESKYHAALKSQDKYRKTVEILDEIGRQDDLRNLSWDRLNSYLDAGIDIAEGTLKISAAVATKGKSIEAEEAIKAAAEAVKKHGSLAQEYAAAADTAKAEGRTDDMFKYREKAVEAFDVYAKDSRNLADTMVSQKPSWIKRFTDAATNTSGWLGWAKSLKNNGMDIWRSYEEEKRLNSPEYKEQQRLLRENDPKLAKIPLYYRKPYKQVPKQYADDDPRLKLVEPDDLYDMPHLRAVQPLINEIWFGKEKAKKVKDVPLEYSTSLPKITVSPGKGSNNTLRTTVIPSRGVSSRFLQPASSGYTSAYSGMYPNPYARKTVLPVGPDFASFSKMDDYDMSDVNDNMGVKRRSSKKSSIPSKRRKY